MRKATLAITLAAIGAIGLGALGSGGAVAQQRAPQAPAAGSSDMGAMLMEGLRKTPGCLGVDAGQFRSGKNAIVAWFEDKDAVARWYHSPTHQQVMRMAMGPDAENREHTPLAYVKDGVPIMVMASITFTDEPEIPGLAMPVSQIAIELYSPQPGGAHINGRLAPETFKVEHMKSYSPPPGG